MIDFNKITNYNRTRHELEEFALFSIMVAGKTAKTVARQLNEFLEAIPGSSPFDKITHLIEAGQLLRTMKKHRLGMYQKLNKAFREIIQYDLRSITVEDLEQIHGIGPKTARFFILHSRAKAQHAVLDTHILKYMRTLGHDAPKATPTGRKYRDLERAFLDHARLKKVSVAKLDFKIWKEYSEGLR